MARRHLAVGGPLRRPARAWQLAVTVFRVREYLLPSTIPEVVFLADRVVVMTPRPGRVAQVFDVPMARPRTMAARASAECGGFCLTIYEVLNSRGPVPIS